MNLIWLIILSMILGSLLLMMGPLVGGILAFGIVIGCFFKGLFLLNDISEKISSLVTDTDSSLVTDSEKNASVNYLKDKDLYLII